MLGTLTTWPCGPLLAVAIFAGSACVQSVAPPTNALSLESPEGFSVTNTGQLVKEVTYSGRKFISRDVIDGGLLYRAALITRQSGFRWFVLLHLPGEGGPDVHPPRAIPTFGASYGHWQPHWNYYVAGLGWQPWHPEWGVRFWAEETDLVAVERFEAHAMIEMANVSNQAEPQMNFDANQVARDLAPKFGVVGH